MAQVYVQLIQIATLPQDFAKDLCKSRADVALGTMGRWDVLLPFLAPGRSVGSVVPRSHRDPTDAASRSVSRSSSSQGTAASPRAVQLPDVEDIYDLLTSDSCLLN